MRNLKRVLGLALASVMVLSMMVVGASAANYDDFTDKDEIVNTEAVQMLVELGVLQGKDTGAFDPTGIITRGEMAKIICVVLNKGQDPNLGTVASYSYTDTVGHWAAGYIEYCTQLGIVAGKGDGTFAPNDTVTATEAAKMLLVALGYSAQYEGMTGANWAVATNVLANKNGLYDGLAINVDAGLTRDNAAQMMYNALDADTVTYDYDIIPNGDSVSALATAKETGVTLLTDKFGVTKVEAIVVANEYATAYGSGEGALDEGKTKIEVVSEDDGGNGLGADGTYDVSTPVDMLGKQVTMFIKYKNANSLSDKDAVVYGSPIVSGKNNIVTVTDGSYVENHGTTKGLLYKNDLTVDYDKVTVLKNYEAQTIVAGSERINDTLNQIQGGTLTLIDNDNDDEVEYVIYTEYTAGVVTNYSTSGDGSIKVTGIDKYDDAADVVGFDDVAKGDFVLAIEYGGKLYVEVPETVTGDLQSFSISKATVKLDETTYDISDIVASVNGADKETYAIYDYLNEDNILGTTATYYLDNNGYVVAVCDADETYGNYAVILSKQAYEAGSGTSLGKDARVKVLLADGTIDTYDVYSIGGKKPGETGYTAKETDVNQYDIYSYAITDDGDIKLGTERGPVTTTTSGMSYTKGSSTLSLDGTKYAVTSSTVFLYYDGGDVVRYVGKTSSDIDLDGSVKMAVATSDNNHKEAAVVFVNDTAEPQYDGNYLYIYKEKVTKNSDGYEADVILADGTIETITIDSTTFEAIQHDDGGMKVNAGMYRYSVSDDVYSLETTAADGLVISGTITATRSDYITVGDSYTLTSDTIVAYGATNKTASVGEALNRGDKVAFVINEDDEVEFAVITLYAGDVMVNAGAGDIEDALEVSDEVEISGDVTGEIEVPANKTLVLTGSVSASELTLSGSGTVELKNATIAGDVTVTNTTLDGAAAVASDAALTIDEGTTVNGDAAITVADGGTVTVKNGTTLKPGASITVEDGASLIASIAGQDVTLTEVISGDFTIAMNDNEVEGEEGVYGFTVTINGAAEIVTGKTLQFWANNDELVLGADAELTVSGTLTAGGDVTAAEGATIIVAEGGNISGVNGISEAGTYTYTESAWTAAE